MRLLAISDLHLGDPVNRECFAGIGASPDDWLILAGDVSETEADLALAFGHLRSRFARVIWVPGNHELWTTDSTPGAIRGEARYQALVALARSFGVVTPEDPYPIWPVSDPPLFIVPLFTLYDYTFRPDEVLADEVIAWAAEKAASVPTSTRCTPRPIQLEAPGARGGRKRSSPCRIAEELRDRADQPFPAVPRACSAAARASVRPMVRHPLH